MPFERIRDSEDKSTHSLPCGILGVGGILIALVFGVPFASATPLEEAAGAAESVVTQVTGASAPPLPNAPPPPPPPPTSPPPAATPTAPVPANPTPVTVPTPVTPTSLPSSHLAPTPSGSATKVAGSGADLPSIGGMTSAVNESAGRVTSTSMEAAQRAAAPVHNDADAGSDPPGPRAPTSRVGTARSADAILPRWFAYVWPAIALGRTGKVLAALLARWEGATSLPASDIAPSTDIVRRLFQRRGITGNDAASAISEHSAVSDSPFAARSVGPVSGGGMSLFLTMVTSLLALIGLIALARLVVGEEFFSFLRWPQ